MTAADATTETIWCPVCAQGVTGDSLAAGRITAYLTAIDSIGAATGPLRTSDVVAALTGQAPPPDRPGPVIDAGDNDGWMPLSN